MNSLLTIIGIVGTIGSIKPDNFILKYLTNQYRNYKNSKAYVNEYTLSYYIIQENHKQDTLEMVSQSFENIDKLIPIIKSNK